MYKGSGIFELTKNVLPRKKILGIPRRNWIECIIFTGVVEAVIFSIPFTKTASFMFSAVFGGGVFFISLRGIYRRSITQFFFSAVRFHMNKCMRHLRGPAYMRKGGKYENHEYEDKSEMQILIEKIKSGINEFIAEYSEN